MGGADSTWPRIGPTIRTSGDGSRGIRSERRAFGRGAQVAAAGVAVAAHAPALATGATAARSGLEVAASNLLLVGGYAGTKVFEAARNTVYANPSAVPAAAEFVGGFMPGPFPGSKAGLMGFAADRAKADLFDRLYERPQR